MLVAVVARKTAQQHQSEMNRSGDRRVRATTSKHLADLATGSSSSSSSSHDATVRKLSAVSQRKTERQRWREQGVGILERPAMARDYYDIAGNLSVNFCVARVCCKSVRHWVTAAPSNSTQITGGGGVDQLLCFRCMQAIAVDTVIAYITHDDRPNVSSASSKAKRPGLYLRYWNFITQPSLTRPACQGAARAYSMFYSCFFSFLPNFSNMS